MVIITFLIIFKKSMLRIHGGRERLDVIQNARFHVLPLHIIRNFNTKFLLNFELKSFNIFLC